MFRSTLYALTAAAGIAVPVTATTAEAREPDRFPAYHEPNHRCWEVLVRGCNRDPWRSYGRFDEEYRARRVAHEMRHRGFEVLVAHR